MSEELDPFTQEPPSADVYSDKGESLNPKPQPEPESYDGSREGLRELADARSSEERPVVDRYFLDDDRSKPADTDRPVSAKYAAEALQAQRNAETQEIDQAWGQVLAQEVDELRGQAQPPTPELGQPQPQELQPQAETPEPLTPELDALLSALPVEQRAPFISTYNDTLQQARHQAATEYVEVVQRVQNAGQQYQAGVVQSMLAIEAAALAPFDELRGVPRDQIDAVVAHIARTNPQRHQQIKQHISAIKEVAGTQLQQAQALQQQQAAASQAQQQQAYEQFRQYAELHDSKTLVNETPETRKAIETALIQDAEREGIDKQTLVQVWNTNPVARHSFFQNLIADGLKYRLAQRSIPRAVSRPIPHVVKPGTSSEGRGDYSQYAEVSREFRGKDLSVKDATRLLLAKRASR